MDNPTITYTLERHDVMAFQKFAAKHLPVGRRMRYINLVLFAGAGFLTASTAKEATLTIRTIMFFLVFFVLWAVTWIIEFFVRKIAFWRVYTSDKNKTLLCKHTITLADDGLIEVTALNEGKNRWRGIYRIIDSADYIYVFTSHQSAHVIPKRAFTNGESARQFFEHATRLHTAATRQAANLS